MHEFVEERRFGCGPDDDLTSRIESYSPFAVMSSLIFGFAVNFFSTFGDGHFGDQHTLRATFGALMSLVLGCNAFTMIVMSLTDYHVRNFLSMGGYRLMCRDGSTTLNGNDKAAIYLAKHRNYRQMARNAFYFGLISFLIAVVMYVQPNLDSSSQVIVTVILGLSTFCVTLTTIKMQRYGVGIRKKNVASKYGLPL